MTYSEIYETIWDMDHPDITKIKDISVEEIRAWKVIQLLNGRRGFNDWWGNINDDIQDEIFEQIVDEFKKGD